MVDGAEVVRTPIDGLLLVRTAVQVHDDGWFKEGWHEEKLVALGLPGFRPVQLNVANFARRGITRGFHTEPWDRLVGVVAGRAFGAWVDLRPGVGFGTVFTCELDQATSVFVPRGVGNAFQVLEDGTTFSFLLSEHWTPEARDRSLGVDLFDPALRVAWPIPRAEASVSARDEQLPTLARLASAGWNDGDHPGLGGEGVSGAAATAAPVAGAVAEPRHGPGRPFRVLFVCTGNICRSAYADVVARGRHLPGLEFASAGTYAMVGSPMDPPMAAQVRGRGDVEAHRARQLTRDLMAEADLVLAMASEHRRYILDEWPALGRKVFVIGQAARELGRAPDGLGLGGVADLLWARRSVADGDSVDDPYRRGDAAARATAGIIDAHLDAILGVLAELPDDRRE